MTQILVFIIIILAVAVGLLAVFAYFARREVLRQAQDKLIGICEVAMETASQKQARKQKIMALFGEKNPSTGSGQVELSNSEIREALGVSSRTAVRYLDELEEESKIEQVGKTGNAVTYRLK